MNPPKSPSDEAHPLGGVTICMLVTNDVSRDARVQKEARSAAEAGARVVVLGTGTELSRELDDEPFEVRLVEPMVASASRVWLVRVARNLVAGRLFERRMADAATELRADIYHANDLDTLPQGAYAAQRASAALVYDAHELSTEAGTMKRWQQAVGRLRERRGIRRADGVVCVNEGIAAELASRYGVPLPVIVYNGGQVRVDRAQPVDGPIKILFQGQFFADRGIPELIEAVGELRGSVLLTLQGWGGIEDDLRRLVRERGLEASVSFVEPCSPMSVVECASRHDVGVINHHAWSLNHYLASPNKLFDYICAGLAVVAPDYPVFRAILADAGCGVLVPSSAAKDVASTLRGLVSDPERVLRLKSSAVAASPHYIWSTQAEKLVAVYVAAVDRNRRKGLR